MEGKKNMKKSQGEIFGIALLFVIIVIGILVYVQAKALNPDREEDLQEDAQYKLLAESSLRSIFEASTNCYVERGDDSLRELVNFCMEFSFSGSDPSFTCEDGTNIKVCEHVLETLNSSLYELYNTSLLGPSPFELRLKVPANKNSILDNISLTNFADVKRGEELVTENNYRALGYKRAPSGLLAWATAQQEITAELYLYYR
jgi:hypothetical protein